MRGFARRSTVEDVRRWVDENSAALASETASLTNLSGRVLAAEVTSTVDVPGFDRAMMDGFALLATDTEGASTYNRLPLDVIGQAMPGNPCDETVSSGKAIRIMTGSPIPAGADAVLPVEQVEIEGDRVFVLATVPPQKHIGRRGEDIADGSAVLHAGRKLRPQDAGVLSSVGVAEVPVIRRPRVRILVTGNELLPPGTPPSGFQIADANSPMLEALIRRDGGVPIHPGIIRDDREAILAALKDDCDIVLVSGGSSVGQEDHVPQLLAEHGDLAHHGVSMRPSSPAGMGTLDGRLVFLLPGNPVSCLCAYDFFAGRAIRALGGLQREWPYTKVTLPLRRKLVSVVGRVDYARVAIAAGEVEPLAISGASMLSSTVRADGFVVIPGDSEGYPPGDSVDVFLYEN